MPRYEDCCGVSMKCYPQSHVFDHCETALEGGSTLRRRNLDIGNGSLGGKTLRNLNQVPLPVCPLLFNSRHNVTSYLRFLLLYLPRHDGLAANPKLEMSHRNKENNECKLVQS